MPKVPTQNAKRPHTNPGRFCWCPKWVWLDLDLCPKRPPTNCGLPSSKRCPASRISLPRASVLGLAEAGPSGGREGSSARRGFCVSSVSFAGEMGEIHGRVVKYTANKGFPANLLFVLLFSAARRKKKSEQKPETQKKFFLVSGEMITQRTPKDAECPGF